MSRGRVQAQLEVASKRGSEKRITKGATPVAGGGTYRCAGRRKRPLVLFDGSPWCERAGAMPAAGWTQSQRFWTVAACRAGHGAA